MRFPLLLLLAVCAGPALAQYKCTAANGAVTFQGTPCFGFSKEQKLEVKPNGWPAGSPASAASGVAAPVAAAAPASAPSAPAKAESSVDKRMLARYQKQNEREEYEKAIQSVQEEMSRRSAQKAADVAAVQRQIAANPADAQTLNGALQSINSRYQALEDLDSSRLSSARAALAAWDKAQK
jgi:hypothetical protein